MNKPTRILIADDDPAVLFVVQAALDRVKDGYNIMTARSGSEALRLLENDPFALVITDVRMPGVDGVTLVEAIRSKKTPTAVIWMTAYGCDRLRAVGESLGVYRCLDKPLRIDVIRQTALEALHDLGNKHSSQASAPGA